MTRATGRTPEAARRIPAYAPRVARAFPRPLRALVWAGAASIAAAVTLAPLLVAIGIERRPALLGAVIADPAPPVPDHADGAAWAARLERADAARAARVPRSRDAQPAVPAHAFYLHAGANGTPRWNGTVDRWLARFLADGPIMERFASALDGCCRLDAPRFRQEALLGPAGERRDRATSLAYADVRAAFRHDLARDNAGRSIVIAGSQSGGRHAPRLRIDEFAGRPLRARLVAAYLVGARVGAEARAQLGDVPICDEPHELGCGNVWSAAGRQARGGLARSDAGCVNPLAWRADGAHVPPERSRGSISSPGWGRATAVFHTGLVDARCEGGWLWLTPPANDRDHLELEGAGDDHVHDHAFPHGDLRANAIARVARFGARRSAA